MGMGCHTFPHTGVPLMKIGIIGMGHVGRNVERRFTAASIETVTYDNADGAPYPRSELKSCDFVVICVGTPKRSDGAAEVSDVFDAITRCPSDRILLRSTVPPGTTEALVARTGKSVCFSPEYVGETTFASNTWDHWADDRTFQIIGGHPGSRSWFLAKLTTIYGASTRFFECTSTEAEIIKYMENCFFAAKITFVNEFYDLCKSLDSNWFAVREGWLLDPRIERDHTAVMPDDRGFSGRCLPKDVDALLQFARERGLSMPLMKAVRDANERLTKERASDVNATHDESRSPIASALSLARRAIECDRH